MQVPASFRLFKNFSPILTSDNDWDIFDSLPEKTKDKLSTCSDKIKSISSMLNITPEQASGISLAVRKFYLRNLDIKDLAPFISQKSNIDPETARKISEQVIAQIINDDSFEKAYAQKVESLPIREALQKYPESGEEILTSEKIILKGFPDEVRPSIKNWISDYTFNLGYGEHDSIQRGRYLFQNQNAKKLSEEERERLSFILRAFDENLTIEINRETKKITIPTAQSAPRKNPGLSGDLPFNKAAETNIQSAQFDFHQKMPFEKKQEIFKAPVRETPREIRTATPASLAINSSSQTKPVQQRPLSPQRITPRGFQMRNFSPSPPNITAEEEKHEDEYQITPKRNGDFRPRVNLVSGISEEKTPINPKNVVDLKNL